MTTLRQRLLEDLQRRNYAPSTIASYVLCVAQFARHFGRSPDLLGADEIRACQLHLLQVKRASWSAYNQSACALRFFYGTCLGRPEMAKALPYGKRPKTLPTVLSRDEVLQFFAGLLLVVLLAAQVRAAGAAGARQPLPCPHCGGQDWQTVGSTPRPRVSEVCRLPLPQVPPPDSS